jgi:hypothetical protein
MRPYLETSWAPINELNGTLSLDGGNSGINVLGYDISAVQHATRHVFAMTGITFDHLVGRLEAGASNLSDSQLLMISFFCGNDRCIGNKREVDTRIWDQIGLEFCKIDVKGSIETERCRDGRDNLPN